MTWYDFFYFISPFESFFFQKLKRRKRQNSKLERRNLVLKSSFWPLKGTVLEKRSFMNLKGFPSHSRDISYIWRELLRGMKIDMRKPNADFNQMNVGEKKKFMEKKIFRSCILFVNAKVFTFTLLGTSVEWDYNSSSFLRYGNISHIILSILAFLLQLLLLHFCCSSDISQFSVFFVRQS